MAMANDTAGLAEVLSLITGGRAPAGTAAAESNPTPSPRSVIERLSKRLAPGSRLPLSRPDALPTPDWPEIF